MHLFLGLLAQLRTTVPSLGALCCRSVVDVFVRYPATSVVDVDAIKLRLAATEQAIRWV